MYVLRAKPTVEKDLRSINPKDLPKLNEKIKSLAAQPRQVHTEKLMRWTICIFKCIAIVFF